jgi:uncharacterized membrane protein (UPF0127 family)
MQILRHVPGALLALALSLAAPMAVGQTNPSFESGVAAPQGPTEPLSIETAGGVRTFKVEIADDPAAREKGLMFRTSIAPDAGMLFDFHQPQPVAFWMLGTPISLDIIFIGADGRILNIAERAVPYSKTALPSAGPALGVLEIAGGASASLGIKPGDRVRHRIFPN